jgi:Fe-S-cluster containining protein
MELEEVYRALANALRMEREAREKVAAEAAALRAEVDQLREILIARGQLAPGHRAVLERAGGEARKEEKPKVKLRVYRDKYTAENSEVDCQALFPLCHARCCAFEIELSQQDVDEGIVRWEVEDPYVIYHDSDGYCSHHDRATGGCTIYEHRPWTCRVYDCRFDARIWIDFEKKIPAPMPPGLKPGTPRR